MALTVVKCRKPSGEVVANAQPTIYIKSKTSNQQQILKKPFIKLEGGTNLVISKIPATIKPALKRNSSTTVGESLQKSTKYSLQTIASTGTPLTSFQWQQTIGGPGGTTITKKPVTATAINALNAMNTTIVKSSTSGAMVAGKVLQTTNAGSVMTPVGTTFSAVTADGNTVQVRRPTILIKREMPRRTIRAVTFELIEKNPQVHLGVSANRLPILKNVICPTADVSMTDCYITLKKIRQNEEFPLLAEYFEMTDTEVEQIFARTVVKLARYMRFLIRWSDSKKYYDRHKNMPIAFRSSLTHVQSLIECVETDLQRTLQFDCSNYKFILSITPNGVISYVSEAFMGHHDDIAIFSSSNFKSSIPKHLSLFVDPGKAIRRKRKLPKSQTGRRDVGDSGSNVETDSTTDSADESADDDVETDDGDDGRMLSKYSATRVSAELASQQTMKIVNSELTSSRVKGFTIPTMRVREPVCRDQMRQMITTLREFKILQSCAVQEPLIYQYLSEVIVIAAAITNLQR